MKKLLLLILLSAFIFSCENDDNTVALECGSVTNVQFTEITSDSFTASWGNPNPDTIVQVELGTAGFTPGDGVTTTALDNSVSLTGLSANTAYEIYLTVVCSMSSQSATVGPLSFTTDAPAVVAQFLPNLSELNIFSGTLSDLQPSSKVFQYELASSLFSDYSKKQRLIALPEGTSMEYDGDGFPIFPFGTLISKTFYYNYNEQDLSQGRRILETRILIYDANGWSLGNYLWNEAQTEATLDSDTHTIPVDWINEAGQAMSVNYVVPDANDCFTCHNNNDEETVIGPKLRTLNFQLNGSNQLQEFINAGYLINAPDVSTIGSLPEWEDDTETLENRARAYFDINCAHCHTEGGFCELQSTLRLAYETPFGDTQIFERRNSIRGRMQTYIPGFSMPFIGTTMVHTEGFALIDAYLDSLE
ncbi:MAG: fibronectin type III domain-containing protein [bacterium]